MQIPIFLISQRVWRGGKHKTKHGEVLSLIKTLIAQKCFSDRDSTILTLAYASERNYRPKNARWIGPDPSPQSRKRAPIPARPNFYTLTTPTLGHICSH